MKPNPPVLAFAVPGIVGSFMVLGAAVSVIFASAFPRAILAAALLLGAVSFVCWAYALLRTTKHKLWRVGTGVLAAGSTIALGVVVFMTFGVFFSLASHGWMPPDSADPDIVVLGNLRVAVAQYVADAGVATDARPRPFPASLRDLVTYGYLDQRGLEKLVRGRAIEYVRPPQIPAPRTRFLVIRRPGRAVVAEWQGDVYVAPR